MEVFKKSLKNIFMLISYVEHEQKIQVQILTDSDSDIWFQVTEIAHQCPNLQTRVFVKTSPKRSYSVIENERFELVFAKTGSIISGTGYFVIVRVICTLYNVHCTWYSTYCTIEYDLLFLFITICTMQVNFKHTVFNRNLLRNWKNNNIF